MLVLCLLRSIHLRAVAPASVPHVIKNSTCDGERPRNDMTSEKTRQRAEF